MKRFTRFQQAGITMKMAATVRMAGRLVPMTLWMLVPSVVMAVPMAVGMVSKSRFLLSSDKGTYQVQQPKGCERDQPDETAEQEASGNEREEGHEEVKKALLHVRVKQCGGLHLEHHREEAEEADGTV